MRFGGKLTWLTLLLVDAGLAVRSAALDRQKLVSQFTHTTWIAKDGIPGPVRAIIQTRDGYLWLGTEAGLYRFDGLRFYLWEPTHGEQLPRYSVTALCAAHDGSLWVGFDSGGIGRLRDGRITIFSPQDGTPGGGVLSIAEDRNGAIWAGGQYGFSEFEGGKWHRVGIEVGYPAPGAQALLVDRKGNLWVATDGLNSGLSKSPTQRNTILTLAPSAKKFVETGLAVGYTRSIKEAPDGNIWIADATAHIARQISGPRKNKSNIQLDGEPNCILFDRDRSVWVGLIGGGIRRVADLGKASARVSEHFEPNDGLSGGIVDSIFETPRETSGLGLCAVLTVFARPDVFSMICRPTDGT